MQSLPRHEPVGLLIGAAVRRIKQAVTARVQPFGLASRQFWVLVAVLETDGPSLRELAARLRIDEPTASRVVAALTRRRLVRVEADPGDRRLTRLRATPSAQALRRGLFAAAAEIRGAVVAGFRPAEEEALREGLRRVVANVERFRASAGGAPVRSEKRSARPKSGAA